MKKEYKNRLQIDADKMIRQLEQINNYYLKFLETAKSHDALRSIAIGWDFVLPKNIEEAAKHLDNIYTGKTKF